MPPDEFRAQKRTLPVWLLGKSLIVGTAMEVAAKKMRWLLGSIRRHKHPELWELHLEERWLPLILQKLLKNDSCGVDVGGHIGSFVSLLVRYAPDGRHIVFEPSATKSRWLKKRFPAIKVFAYAAANETGRAVFEENCAEPGYSALAEGEGDLSGASVRYDVEVCRLDDILLGGNRIDLIKLDVEGGELAALRGASKIIEKWQPAIIFECGSEYGQKLNRRGLYNFIADDLGYAIFCFADFLYDKGEMTYSEFRKCGLYPFRAFNFVAVPRPMPGASE